MYSNDPRKFPQCTRPDEHEPSVGHNEIYDSRLREVHHNSYPAKIEEEIESIMSYESREGF